MNGGMEHKHSVYNHYKVDPTEGEEESYSMVATYIKSLAKTGTRKVLLLPGPTVGFYLVLL